MGQHAVENGNVLHVSASQIKQFQLCPRKWFYNKVLHLPEPEQESTAEGTRMHGQVENYLLNGIPPEHASIRLAIKQGLVPKYVPEGPDRTYEVEAWISRTTTIAGVEFKGRIDLRRPPIDGVFSIRDWKSAKTFNYAPTPEDLSRDVQGLVYLYDGFRYYAPWAVTGTFDHVMLGKTKASTKLISTDPLTKDYVDEMYHGAIEPVVEQMKQIATTKSPDDVPYDLKGCDKWSGCAFKDRCSAVKKTTVAEDNFLKLFQIQTPDKEPEMDIIAEMKARKEAKLAAVQVVGPTPKIATTINPPDAARPVEVERKIIDGFKVAARNMTEVHISKENAGLYEIAVKELGAEVEQARVTLENLAKDIAEKARVEATVSPIIVEALKKVDEKHEAEISEGVRSGKLQSGIAICLVQDQQALERAHVFVEAVDKAHEYDHSPKDGSGPLDPAELAEKVAEVVTPPKRTRRTVAELDEQIAKMKTDRATEIADSEAVFKGINGVVAEKEREIADKDDTIKALRENLEDSEETRTRFLTGANVEIATLKDRLALTETALEATKKANTEFADLHSDRHADLKAMLAAAEDTISSLETELNAALKLLNSTKATTPAPTGLETAFRTFLLDVLTPKPGPNPA